VSEKGFFLIKWIARSQFFLIYFCVFNLSPWPLYVLYYIALQWTIWSSLFCRDWSQQQYYLLEASSSC
jgi:hypothetical protein